jgi:protein disulfide-isomerase
MQVAIARTTAFAFVLASLWSLSNDSLAQTTPAGQTIQWESDLRAAHTRAQQENKHLLLHFYSDNCVWCDRLEAGAFKSPQVIDSINQNYVALKIHAGQNPSLAKTFRVSSFPTDVIVTTAGTALAHGTSPQAADRYVAMLAQHLPQQPATQTPPATQSPADSVESQTMLAQNVSPTRTAVSQNPYGGPAMTPTATEVATTAPANAAVSTPTDPQVPSTAPGTPAMAVGHRNTVTAPEAESTPPVDQPRTLAMDGYCAVTLLEKNEWVEGDPQFGVIHLGNLYLFVDGDAMQRFLAEPEPYTPVLNGIDVVRFFEEKRIVQGKRDFGVRDPDHNRMFFFADEAALIHFENQHARYTEAAISVTRQAAAEANPRR